jgi:hypothetical protein
VAIDLNPHGGSGEPPPPTSSLVPYRPIGGTGGFGGNGSGGGIGLGGAGAGFGLGESMACIEEFIYMKRSTRSAHVQFTR